MKLIERELGDKIAAKQTMEARGVRTVPAHLEALTAESAPSIAKQIGYPILLKAAAGGGGKGMRVVRDASELQSSFESTQREAQAAFGDDRIFIEKFLEQPRHIEVQVLADQSVRVRVRL